MRAIRIGGLPILGQMVGSRKLNPSPSELIVILTPTLVQPLAMPSRERPAIPPWPAPFLQATVLDQGHPAERK